jgi:hypothetical protein
LATSDAVNHLYINLTEAVAGEAGTHNSLQPLTCGVRLTETNITEVATPVLNQPTIVIAFGAGNFPSGTRPVWDMGGHHIDVGANFDISVIGMKVINTDVEFIFGSGN